MNRARADGIVCEVPHHTAASIGQRAGALVLDIVMVLTVVAVPTVVVSSWFGPADTVDCLARQAAADPTCETNGVPLLTTAMFFGLLAVYVALHSSGVGHGGGVGHRVVHARVTDHHTGEPIGFWRGLLRTLVAIVGLAAGGLGLGVALTNRDRRAAHDFLVGTMVVAQ